MKGNVVASETLKADPHLATVAYIMDGIEAAQRDACLLDAEHHTLASRLCVGEWIVVDGIRQRVESVTRRAGVVPMVVLRTNVGVRLVPAGRVVQVAP